MPWLNHLPAVTGSKTSDKLVAVCCVMRILSDEVIGDGSVGASRITDASRRFEEWLSEATGDDDRRARHVVLIAVCMKASADIPLSRVLTVTKDLHRHVTR